MSELEELKLAYAECSRQRNELLNKLKSQVQPAQQEPVAAELPFGVGGGLVAIKTLLSRDPCVHANTAIQMIDAILAEHPAQKGPVAWRYTDARGGRSSL